MRLHEINRVPKGGNNVFLESTLDLGDSQDLDFAGPAVWNHFMCFLLRYRTPHLLKLFRKMLQHCPAVKL